MSHDAQEEEGAVLASPVAATQEEQTRVIMWYGWGFLSAFCFMFILMVFVQLIVGLVNQYYKPPSSSRHNNQAQQSRKTPFNLYLVFLMIPDLFMSGFCTTTCLANAMRGQWLSMGMCYFQSWYVIFGFTGSSWMNALIAAEVYRMLSFPMTASQTAQQAPAIMRATTSTVFTGRDSFNSLISVLETNSAPETSTLRRYQPPTLTRVARDSLAVLIFAAFVSSWGLWGASWIPLKTGINDSGISCFPSTKAASEEVGTVWANLFYYGFFIWVILGAPLLFVSFLCYKIAKYNLLPPEGRKRILVLFFFRLAVIFFVMWLPTLIMTFILGQLIGPWVEWFGGIWGHLQGLVSAAFILWNMDVFQPVKQSIKQHFRTLWNWRSCCARGAEKASDAHPSAADEETATGITPPLQKPQRQPKNSDLKKKKPKTNRVEGTKRNIASSDACVYKKSSAEEESKQKPKSKSKSDPKREISGFSPSIAERIFGDDMVEDSRYSVGPSVCAETNVMMDLDDCGEHYDSQQSDAHSMMSDLCVYMKSSVEVPEEQNGVYQPASPEDIA